MTTMVNKSSFVSALLWPFFLILMIIILLVAPASAFADNDENQATESSPTTEQTVSTDQFSSTGESTFTGQFESPAVYGQDTPAISYNIDTNLPVEALSDVDNSNGTTDYPVLKTPCPSQPDEQSKPAELIASVETAAANIESDEIGTSDNSGSDRDLSEADSSEIDDSNGADDTSALKTTSPSQPNEQSEPTNNTGVGNSYTAEITSEIVVATDKENTTFNVMFTEIGDKTLGSIQLTLPEGFSSLNLNNSSIQAPGGKIWTGGVVDLVLKLWAEDSGSYLVQNEAVTVAFTATTPELPTGYTFSTKAWTDNSATDVFNAEGSVANSNNMAAGSSDPLVWVLHQNSPTHISTAEQLDGAVRASLGGDFIQTSNIDLGTYLSNGGAGWSPIGTSNTPFTGTYDGNGFKISNLYINRPSANNIGLFGFTTETASLKNITLENINVTGRNAVGGLVGQNGGTISNCHASGSVDGVFYVGGLVGQNGGTISNCHASGTVNSISTVDDPSANVGGLVGLNSGTISNSYAEGNVTYETGPFLWYVGGLVGENFGTIGNSYATGKVKGTDHVGGLVGCNHGTIGNSYATGKVEGITQVGGLIGSNYGTIGNSFWDTDTSGQTTSAGGTGKTTSEMKNISTFSNSGWSIAITTGYNPAEIETWYIKQIEGNEDYPRLHWQYETILKVIADDDNITYGQVDPTFTAKYFYLDDTAAAEVGILEFEREAGVNAGSYTITPKMHSYDNNIHLFMLVPGELKINKADATISVNGTTVTYDGAEHGATGSAKGVKGEELAGLDLGAKFNNVPGGTANWTFTDTTGNYNDDSGSVAIVINPVDLTVTAKDHSKVYNGVAYIGGNGVTYEGFVGREDESVLGGTLNYGGTSQGAVNVGSYLITPEGLTSGNYTIVFVDGILLISPQPVNPDPGSGFDSGFDFAGFPVPALPAAPLQTSLTVAPAAPLVSPGRFLVLAPEDPQTEAAPLVTPEFVRSASPEELAAVLASYEELLQYFEENWETMSESEYALALLDLAAAWAAIQAVEASLNGEAADLDLALEAYLGAIELLAEYGALLDEAQLAAVEAILEAVAGVLTALGVDFSQPGL